LSNQARQVGVVLRLGTGATYSPATDDDADENNTLNMRNQAQTEQVEIRGTGTFSLELAFDVASVTTNTPPPDNDNDGDPDASDPDDDNDGIPDTWENAFGLDPFDASDAALDGDGDRFSNLEEYQSDTNPSDITEFLIITDLKVVDNRVVFPAKASRRYTLQSTTGLPAVPWSDVPTRVNLPGVAGPMTVLDPTLGGALPVLKHYRVIARP